MKIYEIRQLKDEEIKQRLTEESSQLMDLRFTLALKNLVNTAKIRQTRKTISRLKTVLEERSYKQAALDGKDAEGVKK